MKHGIGTENESTGGTVIVKSLTKILKPRGRNAFLQRLAPRATILDVGCGNDSPSKVKGALPDCWYIGLDVGDYNQSDAALSIADEYITVSSQEFANAIAKYDASIDAVISSHNLEHCDEPQLVLDAMARALRPGGWIYLAFPSEVSVRFPSRAGTLNFYDDATHQHLPRFNVVIETLRAANVVPVVARRNYHPVILTAVGFVLEPISAVSKKTMPFGTTWSLYGFETVIWGQRKIA